jgi:hypothetical protein
VQAQNNLKQITLAMMDYANANGGQLPPPFSTSPQRQPALSWRVALLPYLGEGNLYRQFRLNEPWTSPHNQQLIRRMPKVYHTPAATDQPGMTRLQVFTGPGTPFPFNGRTRYPAGFTDGTSNTILVTEGAHGVPWTAPQDVAYQPRVTLLAQIARHYGGQGLAGMADGSVRLLPRNLSEATLRALVTPSGGEPLPPNWDR